MNDILKELVLIYLKDPSDVEANWNLGLHYHAIGQTASAVSFYTRAAERTTDVLLQYECMMRAAMCFDVQGIRKFSVKGMLQHAVTLIPERPEAYYYLGKITSNENNDGSWFDSYTYSSLGLKISKPVEDLPPLRTDVDYHGLHWLELQYALSAWYTGLCVESKEKHVELYRREGLPDLFKERVKQNLIEMGAFVTQDIELFKRADCHALRYRFPLVDRIDNNHSESMQDIFVLSMLDGKEDGTYLEIGAGGAFYGNNTYLLEDKFGWKGVSIDTNENFASEYSENRKNPCLVRDATKINYSKFLDAMSLPEEIDYLQIDCDPAENSFKTLMSIPFDTHKFAVITFEHDHYANHGSDIMDKSRKYLESYGYELVVNNIAPDNWRAYEDWWVHPDLVKKKNIKKFKLISDDAKKARDYMLGKI